MRKITYSAFILAAMAGASTSHAVVIFNTGFEFSQGTAPAGPTPWTRTTITNAGPNTVTIKLENLNLVGSEFTSEASLNLNPALNPSLLTFTSPISVGTFDLPSIGKGVNAFKADGDGFFDIQFSFATANSKRFGVGESLTYTVSGITGLNENDFKYVSVNGPVGKNGFLTAWHIQSIGQAGGSGWVAPVPEPGSLLALGAGLLLIRRRRAR